MQHISGLTSGLEAKGLLSGQTLKIVMMAGCISLSVLLMPVNSLAAGSSDPNSRGVPEIKVEQVDPNKGGYDPFTAAEYTPWKTERVKFINFINLKKPKDALQSLKKSLVELKKIQNHNASLIAAYQSTLDAYVGLKTTKQTSADISFPEIVDIFNRLQFLESEMYGAKSEAVLLDLSLFASHCNRMGQMKDAQLYYQKSLTLATAMDKTGIMKAKAQMLYGSQLASMGKLDLAVREVLPAYQLVSKSQNPEALVLSAQSAQLLMQVYQAKGNQAEVKKWSQVMSRLEKKLSALSPKR
ncbi:MAG: hypothetical protein K2X66_11680 [Cyanobacteria bacterium]|nr:hypothetical protein [Cyanobacteriota bacterium]